MKEKKTVKRNIVTALLFIFLLNISVNGEGKKAVGSHSCQKDWYKDAVFYEIWIKSFVDSDNDGNSIGDIKGIISKLDYLNDGNPKTCSDLGITAIKLSPFLQCKYKSTNPYLNMHCYDTTDFYNVNELFGSKEDLKKLIKEAHKRGIKIIMDYVPNQTSDAHPWFENAKNNGDKRDWYVWNTNPEETWEKPWGGGYWYDVWKWNADNSFYYSAYSNSDLPDLNFKNSEVRKKMIEVAEYWLDFGFDGLRVDSCRYLEEDGPGLAADRPGTHDFYKELRAFIDKKYKNRKMILAEAWDSLQTIKDYYGNGMDEFNMCHDFPLAYAISEAVLKSPRWINELYIYEKDNYPKGYRSGTFETNHDAVNSRPYTLYNNNLNKCALSAALNLLSPGTPFIHYGNEIGLSGDIAYGDFEMRKYMNWDAVSEQQSKDNSLLSWNKKLIKARKKYDALRRGKYIPIPSNDEKVLSYGLSWKRDNMVLVFNCSDKTKSIKLDLTDTGICGARGARVYEIIGDFYGSRWLKKDNKDFEIKNIAPYGVLVLKMGGARGKKLCGYYAEFTGGAEEGYFDPVNYESMYIRGSMNNWKGTNPMTKDNNNTWSTILELDEGSYEYKYEISGTDNWDVNFGDNNSDGICEVSNKNLVFTAVEAGDYLFTFNEVTMKYNVKFIE